jgi:hypothetical protein
MYRIEKTYFPAGDRKFWYLHIPKTAGTSINTIISSQFSADESLTHIEIEGVIGNPEKCSEAKRYRYLSGHIAFPSAKSQLDIDERVTLSTFRKPDEHIVSHINFVRKLGEPGEEKRLASHSNAIQHIVEYLKTLDLSKADDLRELVNWMEGEKLYLFHNVQTKYLCGGKGSSTLDSSEILRALRNLQSFDVVGIVERLDEFVFMLAHMFDFTIAPEHFRKENSTNQVFGLDINDKEIRKALTPLIEVDQIIYAKARERFIEELHSVLASVEKREYARFSTVNVNRLKSYIPA